jgi:uncharacterized protein
VNTTLLLEGVVGSRAYGFATENSDTDVLGLFAHPTTAFHGLTRPQESLVTTKPDRTLHEAGKWCRLALKCNPTANELPWLPDDLYTVRHPLGDELISIRWAFLSAKAVRGSYLGYASAQLAKLKHNWQIERKFSSADITEDARKKQQKNARHLVRLLVQGQALHIGDDLPVRLADPGWVVETALCVYQDPALGDSLLRAAEKVFDGPGHLPELPRVDLVEAWLQKVRREFYEPDPDVC